MTIREKQPRAILFMIMLLPGVDALSDAGKRTLVVAAVAGTFVVTFAFLYYFASCCCPSSESAGNDNKVVLTDSDSDSAQSAEQRVIDTDRTNRKIEEADDDSLTVDSGSERRSLWRTFSSMIWAPRSSLGQPTQDEESGGDDAVPPPIPMDTSLDISLAISKLLSENRTKSFSAMAEAFVRSAAISDTLPRDDEVWSGYSGGSKLSVFDDSSCNTTIVRGQSRRELTSEEADEEAWLEFVEVPEALEHSSSSLDIVNGKKNRVAKCSVDL